MDTYSERVRDVHAWQHYYNMTPRTDSRLTEMFARCELPPFMDASCVARELVATEFVYRQTLYPDVIEDFMRLTATTLRETYPNLSWTATWNIVRFYGPIALKLMCISSSGDFIPEHLPCANETGSTWTPDTCMEAPCDRGAT